MQAGRYKPGIGCQTGDLLSPSGHFRVTSLLPGTYRLEAEKAGFESIVQSGILLTTGQVVAIDLTLKFGATSEIVTVEVAPPLTETQSQSVGQLVNRRMVAGLPMPNRAASSLVALAPGVVMIDPGSGRGELSGLQRGGRPRTKPALHAGWRQRNQRLRADAGACR